ncbi:MAG: flagellar hook-associated protein FlgL [Nocardioidaceae bacterium]
MSYNMRVTQRMLMDRSLANLQGGLARLGQAQDRVSSGKAISRPSDSPLGTAQAMALRAQLAAQVRYKAAASDGVTRLGQTDSTLSSMMSSVQRVRDLTVHGSNTGSMGVDARQAIAAEVTQLRSSLIGDANTTYLGRPIFGGTTTNTAAYDNNGNYIGDAGTVNRTVGDGISVRADVRGDEAFGAPGSDLFTVVNDIATHLTTNPSALSADLGRLDAVMGQMKTAQAGEGARLSRMTDVQTNSDSISISLSASLSSIEDVDIASASTDLAMSQLAYQAALASTAKVIQPSLAQFLQ